MIVCKIGVHKAIRKKCPNKIKQRNQKKKFLFRSSGAWEQAVSVLKIIKYFYGLTETIFIDRNYNSQH